MELDEAKYKFIQSWGTLGDTWGINKTMGQIHALLLISTKPLTTDEVMGNLKISRGNANMSLRALVDWGIVYRESVPGERKDYYRSEKDMLKLARQISKERRRREIEPLLRTLQELKEVKSDDKEALKEFKKITSEVESFSLKIDKLLEEFVKSNRNWFYKQLMKLLT